MDDPDDVVKYINDFYAERDDLLSPNYTFCRPYREPSIVMRQIVTRQSGTPVNYLT